MFSLQREKGSYKTIVWLHVTAKQWLKVLFCLFKVAFDKANRLLINSYRRLSTDEGVRVFDEIRETFNIPLKTDGHKILQAVPIAEVINVIPLPVFLARQTDLVVAMAKTGAIVNVKKLNF